jgi:hypothetical protein
MVEKGKKVGRSAKLYKEHKSANLSQKLASFLYGR